MAIYLVFRFDSNPYRINITTDFKGSFGSFDEARAFVDTNAEVSGMNLAAFRMNSELTDSDSSLVFVYYLLID